MLSRDTDEASHPQQRGARRLGPGGKGQEVGRPTVTRGVTAGAHGEGGSDMPWA